MGSTTQVTIRLAREPDLDHVHSMLVDLLKFQKLTVSAMDKEQFKRDSGLLSGHTEPYYTLYVAETVAEQKLVGYALSFFGYKTSRGKFLYLEDIFVKEEVRGTCVGHRLMKQLAMLCMQKNAAFIRLQVLDWNPAEKFYKRCGAVFNGNKTGDWLEYEIDGQAIERLADTMYV